LEETNNKIKIILDINKDKIITKTNLTKAKSILTITKNNKKYLIIWETNNLIHK